MLISHSQSSTARVVSNGVFLPPAQFTPSLIHSIFKLSLHIIYQVVLGIFFVNKMNEFTVFNFVHFIFKEKNAATTFFF